MAKAKGPGTSDDLDTADTASTDQPAIVDTAKFRELVKLDDDGPGEEPEADDGLAITDKFKVLEPDDDSEENPGFDPYNNTERS